MKANKSTERLLMELCKEALEKALDVIRVLLEKTELPSNLIADAEGDKLRFLQLVHQDFSRGTFKGNITFDN